MNESLSIIGLVAGLVKSLGANPAVIASAVSDWLDAHPEATTTVEDGSITIDKLTSSLADQVNHPVVTQKTGIYYVMEL